MTEVPKPEPKKYEWSHANRRGARIPRCVCGAPTAFSAAHAAYYCSRSGEWLEATCGDESCSQCTSRPEKVVSKT
jgi:hypothetical protein